MTTHTQRLFKKYIHSFHLPDLCFSSIQVNCNLHTEDFCAGLQTVTFVITKPQNVTLNCHAAWIMKKVLEKYCLAGFIQGLVTLVSHVNS